MRRGDDYGVAARLADEWFRLTGSIVFSRYTPDPITGAPRLLRYRALADADGAYEITIRSRGPLGRVMTREIWDGARLGTMHQACHAQRRSSGLGLALRKLRFIPHSRLVHRGE